MLVTINAVHLEYLFCQIQTNASKVHADSPSGTCGCTISLALDAVGGRSPFHCPTEWKGLVRMVKYWNNNPKHGDLKPVKPSFLIEVMALECLYGGWGGSFDREIQSFFATLADRVHDEWPDPAGLGPAISNDMDAARKQRAQQLLFQASQDASIAIDHARRGRNIEALRAWRALFGPKFPLS
ncbi:hypothetical protein BN889_06879 [Pseudomonas aeruginosa PA38182]|nr:hypothetical protein BN889_06879 [Pseudomonas aeruginosa PA38182]